MSFPKDIEAEFAAAIFDLGLKHSSPKILMQLMPEYESLTTEHIKSHLQKYRIHSERSKEEFLQYYEDNMREAFEKFEAERGWEKAFHGDSKLYGPDKRGTDPLDHFEDVLSGKKSTSEAIIEQAEIMVAEWGALFENLMIEHAHIQQALHVAIEGDHYTSENVDGMVGQNIFF